MAWKLLLTAALALVTTACLGRPAQNSSDAGEVARGEAGPASDATAGVDSERKTQQTRAEAENARAEKLRRQQDREAIHRQRLGVCVHH